MHADIQNIDTLIKNAKVFNNGEAAVIEDVAVSDGRIVARGVTWMRPMQAELSMQKACG